MNKLFNLLIIVCLFALNACEVEYAVDDSGNGDHAIIFKNCTTNISGEGIFDFDLTYDIEVLGSKDTAFLYFTDCNGMGCPATLPSEPVILSGAVTEKDQAKILSNNINKVMAKLALKSDNEEVIDFDCVVSDVKDQQTNILCNPDDLDETGLYKFAINTTGKEEKRNFLANLISEKNISTGLTLATLVVAVVSPGFSGDSLAVKKAKRSLKTLTNEVKSSEMGIERARGILAEWKAGLQGNALNTAERIEIERAIQAADLEFAMLAQKNTNLPIIDSMTGKPLPSSAAQLIDLDAPLGRDLEFHLRNYSLKTTHDAKPLNKGKQIKSKKVPDEILDENQKVYLDIFGQKI